VERSLASKKTRRTHLLPLYAKKLQTVSKMPVLGRQLSLHMAGPVAALFSLSYLLAYSNGNIRMAYVNGSPQLGFLVELSPINCSSLDISNNDGLFASLVRGVLDIIAADKALRLSLTMR